MAIGRNAPCPCGSGKKFKKCCLARPDDPADATWYRLRRLIDELDGPLVSHGRQLYGDDALGPAWDEFTAWEDVPFDLESPHLEMFLQWHLFDWEPDPYETGEDLGEGAAEAADAGERGGEARAGARLGDATARQAFAGAISAESLDPRDRPVPQLLPTIARSFLERKGKRLDPLAREYLERTCEARWSFHEILEAERGRGFRLRDVLLGDEADVTEHAGSLTPQRGDLIFAKVVRVGELAILAGCGTMLIPPARKGEIIELRATLRRGRERLDRDDLRDFDVEIRSLYLSIYERLHRPPELANTDGEPLSFHTVTWDVESAMAAFGALRDLAGDRDEAELLADAERDETGEIRRVSFDWIKPGNAMHPDWDSTSLGTISIDGARLTAEVNSRERAELVRAEVERRLGDRAVHRSTVAQSPLALLREREERRERGAEDAEARRRDEEHRALMAMPEVRAKLREMAIAHWRAWLDQPVPALGGSTPRDAARSPDGREALEALLLDFEHHSDPEDPSHDPSDVAWLRAELGLDRPAS